MDIGEPCRTYTVEPIEDPVPSEAPVEPVEMPSEAPHEPERAPA
jgi:hypothetical protein